VGENFGRFGGSLSIRQSFIHQKVVRSYELNCIVNATSKVFSATFLAVPNPPKFSTAKVFCYTISGSTASVYTGNASSSAQVRVPLEAIFLFNGFFNAHYIVKVTNIEL